MLVHDPSPQCCFGMLALALSWTACANDGTSTQTGELCETRTPSAVPGGNQPWGGADSSKWRPEAIALNGASDALRDAWASGVRDVIVAMPIAIKPSDYHPFGDGQSNATVELPFWTA